MSDQLLSAVKSGDAAVVQELLAAGADANTPFSFDDGYSNVTPLMLAAEAGHVEVLRLLLKAGARVKAKDRFVLPGDGGGETALEYAVRTRQREAAQILVQAGANINAKGGEYTPLMLAANKGDVELVELLLELGADPRKVSKICSPLSLAVHGDHPEIAARLLQAGADPNWGGAHFGETALIDAAQRGLLECARVLVEGGADVNQGDRVDRFPLLAAAGGGVVHQLKTDEDWEKYGNSTNLVGSCLMTDGNALEIVQLLIAAGADVNVRNSRDETALSRAKSMGRAEICRVLREAGARK